ncbi:MULTISPECIES: hypothetical protein [Corynebacterium]|uniref:hypothetical protein n=2 Tax=Corynebacteriaceae TaxID=1653 RepID=UPI00034EBC23|nr:MULTISPECIES: hypothetical protein [Corynebacterium]AYX81852.1 hypothetical protein EGX79_06440 [Corynebacterium jeikeium]MDU4703787.1 hypothetical protein [Corynebacterium sp.]OFL72709.1 hypothetical protein HMPREF2752_10190 [Corynebacterium sp. HMSC077C02]TXS60400.1 hypothetical protein CHU67_01105 [Corynebacterium sp. LK19]EPD47454.1 hypothetical protein HMPREF1206_01629 [Corynebacterium sp. HFH0082]
MNTYEAMLLARKVRMVLLIIFIAFVAYKGVWWLVAVGILLIGMTLWQNKRLREEIAVRNADELAANAKDNEQ